MGRANKWTTWLVRRFMMPCSAALFAALANACVPIPAAPGVCRDAGFSDREVAELRPAIVAARDAGATVGELLGDIAVACAACAEPDAGCVEDLCRDCFEWLVGDTFPDATQSE